MKKTFFLLMMLLSLHQLSAAKSDLDLEEELKADELSDFSDKEIIVEGEDELLIRPHKQAPGLVQPASSFDSAWNEKNGQLSLLSRQTPALASHKGKVSFWLAQPQAYAGNLSLAGQAGQHLYRLQADRYFIPSEQAGTLSVPNSEHSLDRAQLQAVFRVSPIYQLQTDLKMARANLGLQQASAYSSHLRQMLAFEAGNHFWLSPGQLLTVRLAMVEQGFRRSQASLMEESLARTASANLGWHWSLPSRFSLAANLQGLYGQRKSFGQAVLPWQQASGRLQAVLPLYRHEARSLQIDLEPAAGFAFYRQAVFSPALALVVGTAGWESRLAWEKKAGLPEESFDSAYAYMQKTVLLPELMQQSEFSWQNKFTFSRQSTLLLLVAYSDAGNSYVLRQEADGFLQYSLVAQKGWRASLGIRQQWFRYLAFDLSLGARWLLALPRLQPVWFSVVNLEYARSGWSLSLNWQYQGERILLSANSQILPAAHLLQLGLGRQLAGNLNWFARAENLLNQKILVLPGLYSSGLQFLTGLEFSF